MEKINPPQPASDNSLPRPIVLTLEQLTSVAVAGAAALPVGAVKVIIAGGIPTGPNGGGAVLA